MKDPMTWMEVLADPLNAEIPIDVQDRAVLAINMLQHVDANTFDAMLKFISRPDFFSKEMELVIIMGVTMRNPALCERQAFADWCKTNKTLHI